MSGPILEAGDTLGNETSISCSSGAQSSVEKSPSRRMIISGEGDAGKKQRRAQAEREEETVFDVVG